MKLKTEIKFLLAFVISFMVLLLFNNSVRAINVTEYKHSVEKDGYLFYNNYYDTKDVTIKTNTETFNGEVYEYITISKYDVDKTTFDNISKENYTLLVEVTADTTSAKIKTSDTQKELEIIELNNKKYVAISGSLSDFNVDKTIAHLWLVNEFTLELTKNNTTENKNINFEVNIYNTDYFCCDINIVSENGVVYGTSKNTNEVVLGVGLTPIPAKIDLSKTYVEYLTNKYIGESIKIECLGNVPYVGKYGNQYKDKMNLKNVKVQDSCLMLNEFSYKESQCYGNFELSPDYTIDNVVYVENKATNTQTKLKFDLYGKFKGTIKAEEVQKDDIIYSKVEEELKKYSQNSVELTIKNIYIENGSFEGPIKLTFYVGEEYNGKYYSVVHMKNEKYEFESFEGTVKNGIIEITVSSLSPFGISVYDKEIEQPSNQGTQNNNTTTTPTTNKGEKDNTPKTGTVDIINYVSIATLVSMVGIIVLKKKLK